MEHWTTIEIMVNTWREYAKKMIEKNPPSWMDVAGDRDANLNSVLGTFHTEQSMTGFADITTAGTALAAWLEEQRVTIETRTIYFEIKVKLGNYEASFGADADVVVKNDADLQTAFNILARKVRRAIPSEAVAIASTSTAQDGAGQAAQVYYEDCPVDKIQRSHDGKNWRVRAFGGRWTQYGVPIYDEVLSASNVAIDASFVGDMPYKGTMTVMMEGGKPRRVTKLVRTM